MGDDPAALPDRRAIRPAAGEDGFGNVGVLRVHTENARLFGDPFRGENFHDLFRRAHFHDLIDLEVLLEFLLQVHH